MNIKAHPYKLSAVMALAVTVLFNICFMLFFAYGDYIISSYSDDEGERQEMLMPPPKPEGHGVTAPPKGEPRHAMMEGSKGEPGLEMMEGPKGEPPHEMEDEPKKFPIMMLFSDFVRRFLATFILFAICFNILYRCKYAEWKKMTFTTIACMAWIVAYGYLSARFIIHDAPGGRIHIIRATTTVSLVLGLIIFTSTLITYYVNKWHEAALENETLRTLNYSNQYEALKSKLDPHFLFNALNTLSGLIAIKSDRTEEYLQKLSTIFRTTLSHNDVSTLADEVAFATAYGDLMTIRYEKSLRIDYEIPEEMMTRRIVSFGIQTLLENVIKHNTITMRLPMTISVRNENDYIVVSNPIHPRKETDQSNGLGLKLLSERCMALMGKDIIIENDNEMFTVKIPLG